MPSQDKVDTVARFEEKFQRARGIYFADCLGLNVADMTELRRKCREEQVELRVVKNTLALRSADKAGLKGVDDVFIGPTAVAFGYDDPVTPARILKQFRDSHDLPEIKAFVIEKEMMEAALFEKISKLPTQDSLFTQLAVVLASPLSHLSAVLKSQMIVLVNTLRRLEKSEPS